MKALLIKIIEKAYQQIEAAKDRRRKHIRELEIDLILKVFYFLYGEGLKNVDLRILEFGCGDGFQIPYLQRLGKVIASDIYLSEHIKESKVDDFLECNISQAPFRDKQFNIIFSNGVIQSINDLDEAFAELKRIGKPECMYIFAVPTNVWLLLSLPAQYYNKLRSICKVFLERSLNMRFDLNRSVAKTQEQEKSRIFNLGFLFFPCGLGAFPDFIGCFRSFKISKWCKLFYDNGFLIIKTQPLFLYGASDFPIIPATKLLNNLDICSSVLFIMKKTKEI